LTGQGNTEGRFQLLTSIREFSVHRIILNMLGSLLNFLSNSFLVLLFLLFILIGRNQLIQKVQLAFESETAIRIASMLKNINQQIQRYLIAKSLISLGTGFLFYAVLRIFNVEFAIIWGLLAFLLNFIPNIGSVIATILPLPIIYIQFGHFAPVFWVGLLLTGIQAVIGNFLDPRIVGKSLHLSPLLVLFSLIFWGWLWGFIGMFLAVPIAVVIKIIFENTQSLKFMSVLMDHSTR
jgi:predicted PurR-regulated permease PerM